MDDEKDTTGQASCTTCGQGVSIRDWFAGQVLAGATANAEGLGSVSIEQRTILFDQLASLTYEIADAMIRAREADHA